MCSHATYVIAQTAASNRYMNLANLLNRFFFPTFHLFQGGRMGAWVVAIGVVVSQTRKDASACIFVNT